MAIVKVQSTSSNGGTPGQTLSFASTPTPGNLVIVVVTRHGATVTTPTDNQTGNTYTLIGSIQTTNSNGLTDFMGVYYAKNINSTGTFSITGTSPSMAIFEYSGCDTTAPLDKSAQATGTGTTPTTGSVTPSVNGCLLFVSEVDLNTNNTVNTAGTDFTMQEHLDDNATHERLQTEHYIQPTAAAHVGNMTIDLSCDWAITMGVFKPPAAVGAAALNSTSMLLGRVGI